MHSVGTSSTNLILEMSQNCKLIIENSVPRQDLFIVSSSVATLTQ
jgi:hypothetical protein